MSFTDTEKHWLLGCAAATAASRSDVKVAMPHLRGKWSPTKAILRTLEVSFMRHSFAAQRAPQCFDQSDSPGCATGGKLNGALKFFMSPENKRLGKGAFL